MTQPEHYMEQARQLVEQWLNEPSVRIFIRFAKDDQQSEMLRNAIASFAAEAATATVAKYFCDEHQKLLSESKVEKFVCFWCAQNKIAEREVEAATTALEQERRRLVKAVYNLIDENIEHRSTAQALRKVIAAIGDDREQQL